MKNSVYIATSIDGYIADRNDKIDWLLNIPEPEGTDYGYNDFIENIDALVMGRRSFETVCSFDVAWPYNRHVFVLSTTMQSIPDKAKGKATLIRGSLSEVLEKLHKEGFKNLYIDGGIVIQSFLEADLIDEMIITIIPILLGGGVPLFGALPAHMEFELVESKVINDSLVQNHYRRIRS